MLNNENEGLFSKTRDTNLNYRIPWSIIWNRNAVAMMIIQWLFLSTSSYILVIRWPHEPQYCQAMEQLCLLCPKAANPADTNLLQHFDWEMCMAGHQHVHGLRKKRKDCKYHWSKKLVITSACTTPHNRLLNLECKWDSDFADGILRELILNRVAKSVFRVLT